jgi:hypothetical protein
MVDKRTLEGMQLSSFGDPLDGGDGSILAGSSQQKTAVLGLAIHKNRARSAYAVITTFFCPGQSQLIPQNIQQRFPIFDGD